MFTSFPKTLSEKSAWLPESIRLTFILSYQKWEDYVKYLIKAKDEATKDEKEKKENKIEVFLKKQLPRHRLREGIVENLKHKVFFIDNAERPKKRYDRRRRCRHKLTSKEKRKLGLFKLPKQQSYESFIPLHNLWKDYMKDVMTLER